MIRRFVVGGAVSSVLALTLTGCLGDSGQSSGQGSGGNTVGLTAVQVLAKTSQNTDRLESFKASVALEAGGADSFKATGTMQYRLKPALAYSLTFDQMTADGKSMAGMQQVFIDKTIYMKGFIPAELSQAKPWIKISLAELDQKTRMDLDQVIQQMQQLDPVQSTKLFTASKDAREVGKEAVDGVRTTHYAGTYSVSDALATLGAEQRDAFRKAAAEAGMETMSFDVWVDDHQLPRKMTMKTPQSVKEPMTISVIYRDFGQPVTISAPPASEVADMKQMFGNLPTSPTTS